MKPNHVLVAILVYAAVLSGMTTLLDANHIREPQWLVVSTSLVFSVLVFWWYWLDSEARDIAVRRC